MAVEVDDEDPRPGDARHFFEHDGYLFIGEVMKKQRRDRVVEPAVSKWQAKASPRTVENSGNCRDSDSVVDDEIGFRSIPVSRARVTTCRELRDDPQKLA